MGRIAKLVSFLRRTTPAGAIIDEAEVDAGGNAKHTAQHFSAPGDDSQPMDGDFAATNDSGGAGEKQIVGWHDPKTPRKSGKGGKRIYSRSAPGVVAAEFWMEPDGTSHLEIFETGKPFYIKNTGGTVIVDCPDVRVGDEGASQPIARVGDLVVGAVRALSGAPGTPIVPVGAAPTPTGGVPFAAQIVSGAPRSKAS